MEEYGPAFAGGGVTARAGDARPADLCRRPRARVHHRRSARWSAAASATPTSGPRWRRGSSRGSRWSSARSSSCCSGSPLLELLARRRDLAFGLVAAYFGVDMLGQLQARPRRVRSRCWTSPHASGGARRAAAARGSGTRTLAMSRRRHRADRPRHGAFSYSGSADRPAAARRRSARADADQPSRPRASATPGGRRAAATGSMTRRACAQPRRGDDALQHLSGSGSTMGNSTPTAVERSRHAVRRRPSRRRQADRPHLHHEPVARARRCRTSSGKAMCESALAQSGMPYSVVRPTWLFGGDRDVLVNNIAWILRRVPVFPIPGDGAIRYSRSMSTISRGLCVEQAAATDDRGDRRGGAGADELRPDSSSWSAARSVRTPRSFACPHR